MNLFQPILYPPHCIAKININKKADDFSPAFGSPSWARTKDPKINSLVL